MSSFHGLTAVTSSRPQLAPEAADTDASVAGFPGVLGTFMGRDALTLALIRLGVGPHDTVLLPAYTCQEVLRGVAARARVAFYDVERDLSIDPDRLSAMLRARSVKMVLTTDYFGFLQPHRKRIKEVCVREGAALVEDCAHSLLTTGAGDVGDFAIYSFRKLLPVGDGGGLRVNTPHASAQVDFRPRIYSNALAAAAHLKSILNVHTDKLSRGGIAGRAGSVAASGARDDRVLPMSSFARAKIGTVRHDDVIRQRRADYQFWLEETAQHPLVSAVYPALAAEVCPAGFPARVRNRFALEARARAAGIRLAVHWRLEPTERSECGISHELSAELLTLPVGHDIGHRRELLAQIVREHGQSLA